MSQQKLGPMHVLRMLPRGVGNIVARCLLLWSRTDLVLRLAIIVAYNSFIPITNKEVEDSCLTSTFRIAMLRCSFGEAPKYPFTSYIKTQQ